MTLFEYNTCKKCKSEMYDTKILLHNILPKDICNKICDYNIPCKTCKGLIAKENEFIEKHLPQNHSYTNVELQMLIVDKYFPFRIAWSDDDKIVKYHIDDILNQDEVKARFIKKESLNAIKSFCKKHCRFIQLLVSSLANKKKLISIINEYRYKIFNKDYKYRNKYHSIEAILWLFLYEYFRERVCGYIEYLNFEKIEEYLNEIFDKNNYANSIDIV